MNKYNNINNNNINMSEINRNDIIDLQNDNK